MKSAIYENKTNENINGWVMINLNNGKWLCEVWESGIYTGSYNYKPDSMIPQTLEWYEKLYHYEIIRNGDVIIANKIK